MKVVVLGAGYVGCVSGACLAKLGHRVQLVDIDSAKVEAIRQGQSPVAEPGLEELLCEGLTAGRLTASLPSESAFDETDIAMVCVATPSATSGGVDTSALGRALQALGKAAARRQRSLVVAIRSTVIPAQLRSSFDGLPARQRGLLHLVANPEFLREASAIADFERPPFIVLGSDSTDAIEAVARLYSTLGAPVFRTTLELAFLVKYASNAFHALKVSFANEIGALAVAAGADPVELMGLFCQDQSLNISSRYLRPGFAFGGSCLPKDTRALLAAGRVQGLGLPLLEGVLESNEATIDRAAKEVIDLGVGVVAVLGLSFKVASDDLRESPYLALCARLHRTGISLRIYDPDVDLSRLIGANRAFLHQSLPELPRLLASSFEDAVNGAGAVVVFKPLIEASQAGLLRRRGVSVLDFENVLASYRSSLEPSTA